MKRIVVVLRWPTVEPDSSGYTVHRVLQHTHVLLFRGSSSYPSFIVGCFGLIWEAWCMEKPFFHKESQLSSQSMTFIHLPSVNSPTALHWIWVSGSDVDSDHDWLQEHQWGFLIQGVDTFSLQMRFVMITFGMRLQIRRREHMRRCCAPGWMTWGSPWKREREREDENSAHILRTNKVMHSVHK